MNRHHEVQAYHKVKEMIEAIDALLFGFLDSYSRVIMVRIFKSNHDIRDASRNSVYWGGEGGRTSCSISHCALPCRSAWIDAR